MFDSPWYLLLLGVLPIVAWRMFVAGRRPAVRFSSLEIAEQLQPTLRTRLLWLPSALTFLAIVFLILSLARPREGREQTLTSSEGIGIELVVDRSGSMRAMDFQLDGKPVDRLTAIKNVAGKFVLGDDDSAGRFSDLVGLITFAGFADGATPPTLDHAFLVSKLNQTQIVIQRSEDGTAIGDAISLAVEKLHSLDTRRPNSEKLKSKIVILLTDGENTAGEFKPIQAAELAASMGIKIYTIGVGTKGEAMVPVFDQFMRLVETRMMPVNIDEETLTQVAEMTGGKYYRATDTDSLEKIYAEIDRLEKTKVESRHFVDYRELAVQSYRTSELTVPPLLLIAFVLLAGRVLLDQTWLREMT